MNNSGDNPVVYAKAITPDTKFIDFLSKIYNEYLKTVVIIIIFLIFLNLFITTYFYFTSLIEANANRSNCGVGGLTEAETFRHLFLEDNNDDKTRDIYIIIIIIFSIYLLYEMFKFFNTSNIDDIDNIPSVEITSMLFLSFCLMMLYSFKIHFVYKLQNIAKNSDNKNINGVNILGLLVSLILLIVLVFLKDKIKFEAKLITSYEITRGQFIFICAFCVLLFFVEIPAIAKKDNIFAAYINNDLINKKFKANTALNIIFIVLYLLNIAYVAYCVYNKKNNINFLILILFLLLIFTLFIFMLLSSIDFKNRNDIAIKLFDHLIGISILFTLIALLGPITLLFTIFDYNPTYIKILVLYYAVLFLIYLFYVYFVNHSNESGFLSLEFFQLYNISAGNYYENEQNSLEEKNYNKIINIYNSVFIFILLVILIFIAFKNKDVTIEPIIYSIIVFIIASYFTGIVYLMYNSIFPIQQTSFNYKKNMIAINNEISNYIKTTTIPHTIDKNKILEFKLFENWEELQALHEKIKAETDETKQLEIIRHIFRQISTKGENYDNYVSQSKNQKEYEQYILNILSVDIYNEINTKANNDIKLNIYKNLIIEVPHETEDLKDTLLNIPVSNNLEYIIKKNYNYLTKEEGEIQKYDTYNSTELNCLYYVINTATTIEENKNKTSKIIKIINNNNNTTITKLENITDVFNTSVIKENIYKLKDEIFDNLKKEKNLNDIYILIGDKYYKNITYDEINSDLYKDYLKPIFYTIGYNYKNYHEDENKEMTKNTLYSIPARYYACSYLNYHTKYDDSMSKTKFAKYIGETNYDPLSNDPNIINNIYKYYNEITTETKSKLAPEKFYFLLVFLVILAIVILISMFNFVKKYFTDDVYTPQMYVLGILAVFLSVFIFGEVIFSRIK
jgi:hypothetical protein